MKHNLIDELLFNTNEIPEVISKEIHNLFGVDEINKLSKSRILELDTIYRNMFSNISNKPEYELFSEAYTLRYLPVNFYKVWTPLYDLLEKDLLKNKCKVLDLGCGPGTISMGLIEFYRYLAIENPNLNFEIVIKALEKEESFLNIFKKIFVEYRKTLPDNLEISVYPINKNIFEYFNNTKDYNFDIIAEGNLFNAFEDFGTENIEIYCCKMKELLNSHGSVIMIEPGKRTLQKTLSEFRQTAVRIGFTIYSPCKCVNLCGRFPMAKVDISNISITKELRDLHLSNDKAVHNFEYLILRNDDISKFGDLNNDIQFNDIPNHIGDSLKFSAYIIGAFDKNDAFDLEICDGSESNKRVFLTIPKRLLSYEPINLLKVGRGHVVNVKNAIVESNNKIVCRTSTIIEII